MVAGACLAVLAGALAWHVGAQASHAVTAGGHDAPVSGPAPAFVAAEPPIASSSAVPLPPRVSTQGSSAPAAAASGSLADAPDDRYLPLRTVSLRAGRRGQAYRALLMVRPAAHLDPVRMTGQLPPGLLLGDDGNLRGVPTQAGLFEFSLAVADGASGHTLARQAYALRILEPATSRPRAATVAASAAPDARPSMKTLTENDSAAYVDLDNAVPASYELTSIAPWVPTEDAAPAGSDAAGALVAAPSDADADADANADALVTAVEAAHLPTVDQLRAVLAPLVGVEYPTRALFTQALQSSRCGYYGKHLAALAKGQPVDTRCPPVPAPATATRSPGDPMTLAQFYQALLPARIEKEVIDAALKLHPVADSRPLLLTGDGCGCHAPKADDNVYGMFPFWLATKDRLAVDFSLFSHIGYMGAVLQDNGTLAMPADSSDDATEFARVAGQHETSVDLVVYRRDWSTWLQLDDERLDALAVKAAHESVEATALRFDDATAHWLRPMLARGWRPDDRVYAGLTVFFDDSGIEPAQRAKFKRFYKRFTEEVVRTMQGQGHSYRLNLVVPDAEFGEEQGAFGFTQLAEYMEMAQSAPRVANADAATRNRYKGKTDITVFYLVTLGVPTAQMRVNLRTRVDLAGELEVPRRVALLQAIMPMVFGARLPPGQPVRTTDINNDLAFMRWTYGGVGFWPAPRYQRGQPDPLHEMLVRSYQSSESFAKGVCELACPQRLLLRLLFQAALLVEFVGLVAYAWSCRVRRAGGRKLLLLIVLAGLATLVVGAVVFTCDPLLDKLRQGNRPFLLMVVAAVVWGGYYAFRPRTDPP